jgi:hypothetical protein
MQNAEELFFQGCLKNSEGTGQRVVLVSTGSFNPAHKMHIQLFEYASNYLSQNGCQVISAIVAPSSDEYVKGKLHRYGVGILLLIVSSCNMLAKAFLSHFELR